jgi:hypothetical protein
VPGRTIVVSDLHGFAALLENALDHARFNASDRLVVAGDLVDTGPDDCIAAAQAHGATILAGNHEVSAAIGVDISPQNDDTPERAGEFAERFVSGDWRLAAAVDGWLVMHGGLSVAFQNEIDVARGDVERLASELNEAFRAEVKRYLDGETSTWSIGRSRIVGSEFGPLWFRAAHAAMVPDGLKQVCGHTPCELIPASTLPQLERKPFLLVDPGAHLEANPRHRVRYALIEDGEAHVVGGC